MRRCDTGEQQHLRAQRIRYRGEILGRMAAQKLDRLPYLHRVAARVAERTVHRRDERYHRTAAIGAQLAVVAAATSATNIIEIGTGVGVSGLWMLCGAPTATLTSIDIETDYQQTAKKAFLDAGIAANHIRLITGRAREVLPRMNEQSYDIVLVDADPQSVIEYVEHGLRLDRAVRLQLEAEALEMTELRTLIEIERDAAPDPRSLITKLLASEIRQGVEALAVDAFGLAGLQLPVERPFYGDDMPAPIGPPEAQVAAARYLNARAWSIFGGTSEIQLTLIAKAALGL